MMRFLRAVSVLLLAALVGASGPITTSGQLLAYQDGFVFFTTGDGFKVAPNVAILDAQTHKPTTQQPRPRLYARAVFSPAGVVTEIDLSHVELPLEPNQDEAAQYAVALSTPAPNPDLAPPKPATPNGIVQTFSGKPVVVTFTVEVPPNTPLNSQIYMSTDTSGWNPQAIAMQRVDILHFSVTERILSGTVFRYLYTRGSLQSEERAESGLQRAPRKIIFSDADARAVKDQVFQWADTIANGQTAQPNILPTPFNPGPFPNLPSGAPTPHP